MRPPTSNPKPGFNPDWAMAVRVELLKRQETSTMMSRALGVSTEYVNRTLFGRKPNQNVVDMISKYVGIEPYCVKEYM